MLIAEWMIGTIRNGCISNLQYDFVCMQHILWAIKCQALGARTCISDRTKQRSIMAKNTAESYETQNPHLRTKMLRVLAHQLSHHWHFHLV